MVFRYQGGSLFSILKPYPSRAFLGAWALGGGGGGVPAAHNSKTIHDIGMKFGRVVENHKLINLMYLIVK